MAAGKSNKQIALTLFRTERTIRIHVLRILRKLRVDRTEATIIARCLAAFLAQLTTNPAKNEKRHTAQCNVAL
jgi:ATP/maltotriose-dependent transcriptional regulator MalT